MEHFNLKMLLLDQIKRYGGNVLKDKIMSGKLSLAIETVEMVVQYVLTIK